MHDVTMTMTADPASPSADPTVCAGCGRALAGGTASAAEEDCCVDLARTDGRAETTEDGSGSELWEPWTPEIGQRVRIRLSPECPLHEHPLDRPADGATGTVADDLRAPYDMRFTLVPGQEDFARRQIAAGHWWFVELDERLGVRPDGQQIRATEMCAAELVPLDDGPADRGPDGEG